VNFVAIDVETANADLSSICQVGISTFQNGRAVDLWESLVNPQVRFDSINVSIHGINESAVRSSPVWVEVYRHVRSLLKGNIVVSHTAFDRLAVQLACEKNSLPACKCQWVDSARIVRRAWPEFSRSGYGLARVAQHLGIEYRPHDALEDARCAGEVLVRAVAESGSTLEQWLERLRLPMDSQGGEPIPRAGNPDGPLHGEVLVFTGALTLSRREAAVLASAAGCTVAAGVTKDTTLLVVGDQDVSKLAGYKRSAKHRKAERLIGMGQHIRILSETDFRRLLKF
jgi:DNA polymerase III subunit epsilon